MPITLKGVGVMTLDELEADQMADAAYKMQEAYRNTRNRRLAVEEVRVSTKLDEMTLHAMWEAINSYVDINT